MSYRRMSEYGAGDRQGVEPSDKPTAPAVTPAPGESIERALTALLAFGGSAKAAAVALDGAIDVETLERWRDIEHADQYAALQAEHGKDIEEAMVREMRDIARLALSGQRLAVEKAIEGLDRANPRDAAQIALNLAKVTQAGVDKILALTGRPTTISEHRSATELIRALASKGVIEVENVA